MTIKKLNSDPEQFRALLESTIQKYNINQWPEERKAAALIVPWVRSIEQAIQYYKMGIIGVLCAARDLFVQSFERAKSTLAEIQKITNNSMVFFCDMEMGAGQPFPDSSAVLFPWMMAFGAAGQPELCYKAGYTCGMDARWAGIHITMSPVADVNTQPSNPICNIRSFGDDPEKVAECVCAWVDGQQNAGVGACVKHFPGEGAQKYDPHLNMENINIPLEEYHNVHLVPFERAISAGTVAIMTNHAVYTSLDPEIPATFSRRIVTELLREEMGFNGLIITDALEMEAIARGCSRLNSELNALKAGHDLLLGPRDTQQSLTEIAYAISSGDIDRQQIDYSIARLLWVRETFHAKAELSKTQWEDANQEGWNVSGRVADESICVARDERQILPISQKKNIESLRVICFELAHPNSRMQFGLDFPTENLLSPVREFSPDAKCVSIPINPNDDEITNCVNLASGCDLVLIATSFRSETGQAGLLKDVHVKLFEKLNASNENTVFIIGNPYCMAQLSFATTAVITYSHSRISIVSAMKYIFQNRSMNRNVYVKINNSINYADVAYITHD